MPYKNFGLIACIGLTLLTSCRIGPRYDPPCTPIPQEWKSCREDCASFPTVCYWWEIFNDEYLNALEAKALESSPRLEMALEKVASARAEAKVDRADLFPQLNFNPNYANKGYRFNVHGLNNVIPGIGSNIHLHQIEYEIPISMSYEIDLWGKYKNRFDSAWMHAEAQEEAYQGAMLMLTSEVASNYFNLRATDTELQLLEETIVSRRKAFELSQSRYTKGLTGYLDVTQAEVALANVEANYEAMLIQRAYFENALATLVGIPASEFSLCTFPLYEMPPCVPIGIPSSVLYQRPDIAQAEREAGSAHALIGMAYASLLPSFILNGGVGYSQGKVHIVSSLIKNVIDWKSYLWQFSVNIAQTLLDGGRKCSQIDVAWAQFRESVANYEQTVLTAFQEVENALTSVYYQTKQLEALEVAKKVSADQLHIAQRRYEKGLSSYLEVIEGQEADLNAKSAWINVLAKNYQSTIELMKAFGGRWSISEVCIKE